MELQNLLIVVLLVAGLTWGTLLYLRHMARQALNPRFTWTPLDPARGEGLDITVEVECTQVVHVRAVEAHLIATRYSYPPPGSQNGAALWALEGSQPLGTPEKDICSHSRVLLCREMLFNPGDPIKLVGELDVPGDALPTHTVGRLQIHWSIQIRFEIANFPPLVLEQPLEVRREPVDRPAQYRAAPVRMPAVDPLAPATAVVWHGRDLAPSTSTPPDLELDAPVRTTDATRPGTDARPPGQADTFAHLELDIDRQDPPQGSSKP